MKLSLVAKFNVVFLVVFAGGFYMAGYFADHLLKQSAREEVVQNARILIEAGLAARTYTSEQISPLLQTQLTERFLPQSVPSYSATENLATVGKKFPEYSYKEATLNPTNLRDRATDWEADIVENFRKQPDSTEFVGERDTPNGRSLFIARPLKIKSAACLRCHSTPDAAPPTMLFVYGKNNGFGWQLNETIGAQIVSVPMALPMQRAKDIYHSFMMSLGAVFAVVFVLQNIMLYFIVTRRLTRLSKLADEVSLGKLDAGDFPTTGGDEIATLGASFGRMKTSLVSAMKLLEE